MFVYYEINKQNIGLFFETDATGGIIMNVKVKVWRSMTKRQRYLLLLAIATYQKQRRIEHI